MIYIYTHDIYIYTYDCDQTLGDIPLSTKNALGDIPVSTKNVDMHITTINYVRIPIMGG